MTIFNIILVVFGYLAIGFIHLVLYILEEIRVDEEDFNYFSKHDLFNKYGGGFFVCMFLWLILDLFVICEKGLIILWGIAKMIAKKLNKELNRSQKNR